MPSPSCGRSARDGGGAAASAGAASELAAGAGVRADVRVRSSAAAASTTASANSPISARSTPLSVRVGDRQLLGGIERDDLRALGREHHFLLDARGGVTVGRRAVGL